MNDHELTIALLNALNHENAGKVRELVCRSSAPQVARVLTCPFSALSLANRNGEIYAALTETHGEKGATP